jgi:hypothetical protein
MSEQSNKSSIKTSPSFTEDETTESKVGGTTYIVTSNYKENGEGLLDKLWRLIQNDAD